MKKEIGIIMFVIGIFIWLSIISFVISFPLARVLNTEDVVPLYVSQILKVMITLISLLIALFVAVKRYVLPASPTTIGVLFATTIFLFDILGTIMMPLALGSKNPLAFFSVTSVFNQAVMAVLLGIVTYFGIRFFSREKMGVVKIN